MSNETLIERLEALHEKHSEQSPGFNTPDHKYWLNRIDRARMDTMDLLPEVIAALRARSGEKT